MSGTSLQDVEVNLPFNRDCKLTCKILIVLTESNALRP